MFTKGVVYFALHPMLQWFLITTGQSDANIMRNIRLLLRDRDANRRSQMCQAFVAVLIGF